MIFRNRKSQNISLNGKLRYIIISMLAPMIFCVILVLAMFGYYVLQYEHITHNLNVGSKFNNNFKETIDLKMYHYTVGSKEQKKLPISDVEDAIKLAESLDRTTYRKESRQCIHNILSYCRNLKRRIYNIRDTREYDSRQVQLENNIYVLTNLIQEEMSNYIYYEAGYMSILEKGMIRHVKNYLILAVIFEIFIIFLLFYRAFRFTKGITRPIDELCENIKQVGNGKFQIPKVETYYTEIEQLDTGIQDMAGRISLLLENVKKEEKLQHKTELRLLQAQINPHFLYNTLDTIVWLVESSGLEEAVNMLTNLSVFFRTSLSNGQDIISLREEILHTHSYLDIQQVRYRDILDYDISLPEQLNDIRLPKLTLQPIAENAIYHGAKEKRGKSNIQISCLDQGEDVLLVVSDNGVGMKEERLKEIQDSLKSGERLGFGLAAVHERVKLCFGERYGVRISSQFGIGTTVEILISKKIE